ncbi:hypothetical protein CCY01nite_42620 [Chitinophaga cymbidii]|uniref:Uncharacterized protein n=2 Tax=Chitinophaga cymbidii TaxID=1096750 RepID=A0A512RQM6_9BACT|nr:hypothetical protein CCY01nite_42620 [Chitinophaga cymbidii]
MLLALNSSYAQSSRFLPGTWEGIHKIDHIKDSAYISITIEQVTGRTFSGTSYGHFFQNPQHNYYRGRITGKIDGDRITIDILPISDKKLADYPGFYWCTGRSVLTLQIENGAYVMAARQDPDGCLTGAMRLRKKVAPAEKPESRRNILAQTIHLTSPQFRVALYDNGTIDGDTVSVYFNGQLVADRQPLTANPFVIDLVASDTADNELIMYAENEGRVPPNTALMIIYADDKTYRVKLNAGNRTNAMVRFLRKKNP